MFYAQLPIPIIAYLVLPVSEIPEATKSMGNPLSSSWVGDILRWDAPKVMG